MKQFAKQLSSPMKNPRPISYSLKVMDTTNIPFEVKCSPAMFSNVNDRYFAKSGYLLLDFQKRNGVASGVIHGEQISQLINIKLHNLPQSIAMHGSRNGKFVFERDESMVIFTFQDQKDLISLKLTTSQFLLFQTFCKSNLMSVYGWHVLNLPAEDHVPFIR
eukprot:Platyproteum_vivax@DN3221_c0_g1_i1.p1